jgi:hypothetical protein
MHTADRVIYIMFTADRVERFRYPHLHTGHNRRRHHLYTKFMTELKPVPMGAGKQDNSACPTRLYIPEEEVVVQTAKFEEKLYGKTEDLKETADFTRESS